MIIAITCIVALAVIGFLLSVRAKDLPVPEPESPFQHLDERKAAIYDNLRDLQFEYRVGKLSDEDYQHTKKDLQRELASVLAEVDKIKSQLSTNGATPPPAPLTAGQPAIHTGGEPVLPLRESRPPRVHQNAVPAKVRANVCPSCGATFDRALKFCGECGKAMKVGAS